MRCALPPSVLACAALACAPASPGLQRLELPASPTHATAIVAVTRAPAPAELWVVDLEAAAPLPIVAALDVDDDLRVDALLFEATPAELGLEAGPLAPAGPDAALTVPLPRPDATFTQRVTGGALGAWAAAEVPAELAAVRLARSPRCATPRATDLDWTAPGELAIATPWIRPSARAPDRVIAGLWVRDANDDQITDMYVLSRDGARALDWSEPPKRWDAAHPGPDHSLLLTLDDGEVWRGTVDEPAARFSASQLGFVTSHARAHWVAGPPVATTALYLLTAENVMGDEDPELVDGRLNRFRLDNTPESALAYFEPRPKIRPNPGDLAWVGPEELLVVWPYDGAEVVRYRDGAVVRSAIEDPQQVEHLPGWTTVLATGGGALLVPDGDGWRPLAQLDRGVTHLAGAGDRIWAADAGGRVHQIVPGVGLCGASIASPLAVEALVGLDGGFVIIGSRPGDGRRSARWYRL